MDLVNPARLMPATADHLPIVKRIAEHAYAKYVERIGKPPAPMYDDYEGHLAHGNLHVLERGGEVVAFVVYWEEAGALFLDNVAVLPDFQGTGVGSAFLIAIEDLARKRGIRHLDLYTNTKMVENVELYKAAGFDVTEYRTEKGFERVYMRKTILGPETIGPSLK